MKSTTEQQQKVENVLAHHLPPQSWQISLPTYGQKQNTFIAQCEQSKLFVKFDVPTVAWSRLAVIKATPPILAVGEYKGRSYVIQHYWAGQHPIRYWFRRNISMIAAFIANYHRDEALHELLTIDETLSCTEYVRNETSRLQSLVEAASSKHLSTLQFQQAFASFQQRAKSLSSFRFVPIHADPNNTNILVRSDQMIMIDWGDVALSDPMRDIGLLLWWYLPQDSWHEFTRAYGAEIDRNRIFWWVARQSLGVALYFYQHGKDDDAVAFLSDFYRAVNQQANPQVT